MFSSNTSQVSNNATYIEDVFSTYLYTGNGSTQTITNGIDLAGKGGMVWTKSRSDIRDNNILTSGFSTFLVTNKTEAANTPTGLNSFNSNGYTLNGDTANNNQNGWTYASWTFRKQPKFFDVVTYTGTGSPQTISHSLGSAPGCIIVKSTTNARNWAVYHASLGNGSAIYLNSTAAAFANDPIYWNNTSPTSTGFSVNTWAQNNEAGQTYVAYLFAHNAGGFGLTGTDNVISCGSFTTDGAGVANITLGYEPQFVLLKRSDGISNWFNIDVMRQMSLTDTFTLQPNQSNAEIDWTSDVVNPTATGFATTSAGLTAGSATYIYIAIRRGPMKVPTDGTKVFAPVARAGTSATAIVTAGFPVDTAIIQDRPNAYFACWFDRLRGAPKILFSQTTSAESGSYPNTLTGFDVQTGVTLGVDAYVNSVADTYANWLFRRAPGFFDEVCYTGDNVSGRTINHNLTVTPELIICKARTTGGSSDSWNVQIPGTGTYNTWAQLNTNATPGTVGASYLFSTSNATTLTVSSTVGYVNSVGVNYVVYLFASCPGVSKVGSYTGNGSSQTINMGFTGGARFFLVKRTDSTGDWWVYDSARGIVANSDPALRLNSTAAEVTSADAVDTDSTGLIVNQESTCNINVNGASYIYLGIA